MTSHELISDTFVRQDYEKLMYNVHAIPEKKSVIRSFDDFQRYPEFSKLTGNISLNKVMRYIVYMYDKNSPFKARISNLGQRKYEAAIQAGFQVDEKGRFDRRVEDIILIQDDEVNNIIFRYLKLHRNHSYMYLVALMESYDRILKLMAKGEEIDVKKVREIRKDIEDIEIDLANEDNNKDLVKGLYEFMESEELKLRPEDIAQKDLDGSYPLVS